MDERVKVLSDFWQGKVIVVEEVLRSKSKYNKMRELLLGQLKAGFEIKEIRSHMIEYKFHHMDTETYTMELRHLYIHLCLWYPFVALEKYEDIDETCLIDMTEINGWTRKKFYDEKIIIPYRECVSNEELNSILHRTRHLLASISRDFNDIIGNSMDMYSFIKLSEKCPEFNSMLGLRIPVDMQPADAETMLDEKQEELIEILRTHENVLQPILKAKGSLKEKQLMEFFSCKGFVPDINGDTIPIPINGNFTHGGLGTVSNYYLEANSSIKALLANAFDMGNAGYFSKQVMELCAGYKISQTIEDCGTLRSLRIEIKSKNHLKLLSGQYYYTRKSKRLRTLTVEKTNLIGKTVYLRNVATCACGGIEICPTCYGKLSSINGNGFSIGALAALTITEPVGQNILSTKHLNTTKSNKIGFNDNFDRFFMLQSNEIYMNLEIEGINKKTILLRNDILERMNEFDDGDINAYIKEVQIRDEKTGEIFTVSEESEKEMFLSPELNKVLNKLPKKLRQGEYTEIPFNRLESTMDDDGDEVIRLFILQINNNELTKPLYDIKNLLNSKKHRNGIDDIDMLYQRLLDLLIEADIMAPACFSQILMRPLLRKSDNIINYPNFKKYDQLENYTVLTIDRAQVKNPSVILSISSHSLGLQLADVSTFKKQAPSFLDPLFKV